MGEAVVVARCVRCRATREIRAGEVPPGQMPMCDRDLCYGVMLAVGARTR